MNIRRYKPGEEAEIWQLHYDTTRIIIGQDYTLEQVQRWAPDRTRPNWGNYVTEKNPFVAEHDGQIVGFADLEPDGHIDRFYCHHRWQRRGVGRSLYRAIEERAFEWGLDLIFTEVSVTAQPFFSSVGFEIVEETHNVVCGTVARQFRMRKRLQPEMDVEPVAAAPLASH